MIFQVLLKCINTLLTQFKVAKFVLANLLLVSSGPIWAAGDPAVAKWEATDNTAYGINVSHYQGLIRWDKVKPQGISFAFAKATAGTNYTDPEFETNWQAMRAEGFIRGAYHFFYPADSAAEQAQHFIDFVRPLRSGRDLPPVLNVKLTEGVNNAEMVKKIKTWLNRVEKAFGCKPIIYVERSFADTHLKNHFGEYPLWITQYVTQANPTLPQAWHLWSFWQYSSDEKIDGVNGSVNVNKYNGSEKSLENFVEKLCK